MSKFSNLKIVDFGQTKYQEKLLQYHEDDGRPGLELGFQNLNQLYTHKKSGITDWTGFPSSGKTYFVLEILMQLSEKYNQRHMLYVPDLGTYYETIAKLVKMYTGKDFEKKFHNKISVAELLNRIPQISNDFIILTKEDPRKPITPHQFWEFCIDYTHIDGRKCDTGLIDSWKNMSKDFANLREDQYLDAVLSYRNELAEEGNIHFHTIAHPNKTELEEKKNSDGSKKRRVPTAQDIKGGDSWYANGKNIITIDWPNSEASEIDVHVWKVKPENVGKKGKIIAQIALDIKRGRYFEKINGHKLYAYEYLQADTSVESYYNPSTRLENVKEGVKNMEAAKEKEFELPLINPFENEYTENEDTF
jgi:hypothetical protein